MFVGECVGVSVQHPRRGGRDTEEVTKFVGERDKEKLGCCLPAGPTDQPHVLNLHLDAKRSNKLVM